MSCEPFGRITVEQYLREILPPNTRVFIESRGKLQEIKGIICRQNDYYAEIKNSLPATYNYSPVFYHVTLNMPLYLAREDLTSLEAVIVRAAARRAEFATRLPVLESELPCEGVSLGSYWSG